jgi:hypothetical protein
MYLRQRGKGEKSTVIVSVAIRNLRSRKNGLPRAKSEAEGGYNSGGSCRNCARGERVWGELTAFRSIWKGKSASNSCPLLNMKHDTVSARDVLFFKILAVCTLDRGTVTFLLIFIAHDFQNDNCLCNLVVGFLSKIEIKRITFIIIIR